MAKPKKMSRLAALPLGGVGEIGKNLMTYECDGNHIVVDCGISFPTEKHPGVDVVLPDTRYLRELGNKLKGIFITHGHEDHIGALAYLWHEFDCPVYVSPFARLILEDKLKQNQQDANKRIVTIEEGKTYKAGTFDVEYILMTHSIIEPFALALHTPHGTIVHTGDYKFDNTPLMVPPANKERLAALGEQGVLAMFGDSTGIFSTGTAGSEGDLAPRLAEILKSTPQRLFFSTFASNTPRIIQMVKAASEAGRKTAIIGRTAQKMIEYAKKCGYFPGSLTNWIVSSEEIAGLPPEQTMVIAAGTQGEPRSSMTRLSQGDTVGGIKVTSGDTVLFSSKMIPGNERPILDVCNNFVRLGVKVLNEHIADVHVSGHGGKEEMKQMYDLLKPQILVPVHGEEAHLMAQAEWALACGVPHAVQVRLGQKLVLAEPDNAATPYIMNNTFPSGENYIDGFNILDDDAWIIQDRRKMAFEGLVCVALAVNEQTHEIQGEPAIESRGLIDPQLQSELMGIATQRAQDVLETIFPDGRMTDAIQAQEALTKTVRKVFVAERGKKPVVVVQIVYV